MIFGIPHPGLGGGRLAVPGATDSNDGGDGGVGVGVVVWAFLEAAAHWFGNASSRLLFTQSLNLHLCAKCQWLHRGSGPLCLLDWAFHTLKERQPWNPFPGPVGSCSVKGCRELATRLWIALPHHMATDIMARAVTIATLSLQAHHGPGLVPKAIPVSFKLILRSHHCPS